MTNTELDARLISIMKDIANLSNEIGKNVGIDYHRYDEYPDSPFFSLTVWGRDNSHETLALIHVQDGHHSDILYEPCRTLETFSLFPAIECEKKREMLAQLRTEELRADCIDDVYEDEEEEDEEEDDA